jgi:hypothetical protein
MTTAMGSSVETVEEAPARRSVWGALVAGAAVALACGVMLNLLGAAIGASMVDTLDRDTPSGTAFTVTAGIWMLLASLISYFLGGLVASRLSSATDPDVASMYGLAVWGIGILVSSFVVASSMLGVAGTAAQGAGQAASGVAQALGSAAAPAVNQLDPERLSRELRTRLRGGDVATMSQEDAGNEIGTLIARRVTDGPLPQAERDRLVQLTARFAGVDEAQARQRVDQIEADVTARLRTAEEKARAAADAAATGIAVASYWAFAAIALSAAAAFIGARIGTPTGVAIVRRFRRRSVEPA